MNKLEKAIKIALEAHENQLDKGGKTYILHPLRLMIQMPTEELQIIAVLHDVVEDSHYTFEHLIKEGFDVKLIEALQALTKKENERYGDFIKRVQENSLATKVKIVDLKDNSNLDRIQNPTKDDLERVEKYKKAIEFLQLS
ncbi:GTP pyrophosphokinase [bacterium]|jgi:(p)ppGpp synthase/HD superfamily hydrolase|nr:GTP pyrophosphokinase [bacterium]MBT6756566.1 GTP pyrophosphokinase [Candidatus Paceibacterota bacterium]MBT7706598.1 GTP pyrophosphokinase [archaeon]